VKNSDYVTRSNQVEKEENSNNTGRRKRDLCSGFKKAKRPEFEEALPSGEATALAAKENEKNVAREKGGTASKTSLEGVGVHPRAASLERKGTGRTKSPGTISSFHKKLAQGKALSAEDEKRPDAPLNLNSWGKGELLRSSQRPTNKEKRKGSSFQAELKRAEGRRGGGKVNS